MMESKKYNIIFLALILLACAKENFTAILGESITVSAEIPEDSEDLEFIWELTSVPDKSEIKKNDIQFGDAIISDKHANFFINKDNASYKDMKKLIDFVKENVKNKTGINLDLEIILVE